jgi:hypothetical protein
VSDIRHVSVALQQHVGYHRMKSTSHCKATDTCRISLVGGSHMPPSSCHLTLSHMLNHKISVMNMTLMVFMVGEVLGYGLVIHDTMQHGR